MIVCISAEFARVKRTSAKMDILTEAETASVKTSSLLPHPNGILMNSLSFDSRCTNFNFPLNFFDTSISAASKLLETYPVKAGIQEISHLIPLWPKLACLTCCPSLRSHARWTKQQHNATRQPLLITFLSEMSSGNECEGGLLSHPRVEKYWYFVAYQCQRDNVIIAHLPCI